MAEIEIFFNNGNRARFKEGDVIFDERSETANSMIDLWDDVIVVNWNNVSFVRKVRPREDDDE